MGRMHSANISGHIYRHDGARGPVWRAKYRLPDDRIEASETTPLASTFT